MKVFLASGSIENAFEQEINIENNKKYELLKKLEGTQTIESVKDILHVNKKMAIYYIYRLRKEGYVKTKKQSNNNRVYNISLENKLSKYEKANPSE